MGGRLDAVRGRGAVLGVAPLGVALLGVALLGVALLGASACDRAPSTPPVSRASRPSGSSTPAEPAHGSPEARVAAPEPERPTDAPPPEASVPPAAALADRVAATARATVGVERWAPYVGWQRIGSGVAISADGLALTAAHVVDDEGGRYRVSGAFGDPRPARVVWRDEDRDIAIVDTDAPFESHLPMAEAPTERGAWIVCAGFPGRASEDPAPVSSVGVVVDADHRWIVRDPEPSARFGRTQPESLPQVREHMMVTECSSAAGMSGGPVVRLDGALVGVHVGSGAVISPVARMGALPRALERRLSRRGGAGTSGPPVLRDEIDRPSRHLTFTAGFAPAALAAGRSVFELRRDGLETDARGIAIASDRLLTAALVVEGGAPTLVLPGEPERLVETEIVAVRGELAMLRVSGFDALSPIGPSAETPSVGDLVMTHGLGGPSVGIVTDDRRRPGRVDAAPLGVRGCGWLRGRARAQNPAVTLGEVLVHDTLGFVRGSLIVDRRGRPVAIDVGSASDSIHYAVPIRDALARFEARGPSAASTPVP